MFDVKLYVDNKFVYICVWYENAWYMKKTATRDGKAVEPATSYEPLADTTIISKIEKLPSLLDTIVKQQ